MVIRWNEGLPRKRVSYSLVSRTRAICIVLLIRADGLDLPVCNSDLTVAVIEMRGIDPKNFRTFQFRSFGSGNRRVLGTLFGTLAI
jgi:hypothetical protein